MVTGWLFRIGGSSSSTNSCDSACLALIRQASLGLCAVPADVRSPLAGGVPDNAAKVLDLPSPAGLPAGRANGSSGRGGGTCMRGKSQCLDTSVRRAVRGHGIGCPRGTGHCPRCAVCDRDHLPGVRPPAQACAWRVIVRLHAPSTYQAPIEPGCRPRPWGRPASPRAGVHSFSAGVPARVVRPDNGVGDDGDDAAAVPGPADRLTSCWPGFRSKARCWQAGGLRRRLKKDGH